MGEGGKDAFVYPSRIFMTKVFHATHLGHSYTKEHKGQIVCSVQRSSWAITTFCLWARVTSLYLVDLCV